MENVEKFEKEKKGSAGTHCDEKLRGLKEFYE